MRLFEGANVVPLITGGTHIGVLTVTGRTEPPKYCVESGGGGLLPADCADCSPAELRAIADHKERHC